MNFNMSIPGLKGVIVHQMEEQEERLVLHVSCQKRFTSAPHVGKKRKKSLI